jgi:hypothetical protein
VLGGRKMEERKTCTQPDHDEPRLVCGYPLPCPWHTVILETAEVSIPATLPTSNATVSRLKEIADALTAEQKDVD